MIFTVKQVKTGFDMLWFATDDISKESVCLVLSPFTKGCIDISLDYGEDKCRDRLYYNPNDIKLGSSFMDRLLFRFYRDDMLISPIEVYTQKVKGFLQSYQYRKVNDNNQNFFLYEVGLGSKGLFLCFYKGDKLIAIADKTLTVVEFSRRV